MRGGEMKEIGRFSEHYNAYVVPFPRVKISSPKKKKTINKLKIENKITFTPSIKNLDLE